MMDNARNPRGMCVVAGCAAQGHVWFTNRPGTQRAHIALCRMHLEQMLRDTGLIERPTYRALLDEG